MTRPKPQPSMLLPFAVAVARLLLIFDDWRFNRRSLNTEPPLRLNGEARGQQPAKDAQVAEVDAVICGACA